ncbi:MAG: hypothetical protein ACI4PT_09515, partial [Candidatus Avoscillospira sp.]
KPFPRLFYMEIGIMIIGLNKQLQIYCRYSKNAVIASQSADWRGNPFPLHRPILRKYSEICNVWSTDCRVASLLAITVRGETMS